MLACMRIEASFVPVSPSLQYLHHMVDKLKPQAAIVVGSNDRDATVVCVRDA
jgi:hypothetical protein